MDSVGKTVKYSQPSRKDAYLQLDRQDNGTGTLSLYHVDSNGNKKILKSANYTNWDDAIPWASGNYLASPIGGRFGYPNWSVASLGNKTPDPSFQARDGIQIHVGSVQRGTSAVTGCIAADGDFLKYLETYLSGDSIELKVKNDYNIRPYIQFLGKEANEGTCTSITIGVKGAGASAGLSKDLYFGVKFSGDGINFSNDSGSDIRFLGNAIFKDEGKSGDIGRWDSGYFLKLPAGKDRIEYSFQVNVDSYSEGSEKITAEIVDYYVTRKTKSGGLEKYSDSNPSYDPGILLKYAAIQEIKTSMLLNDASKLTTFSRQGGLEVFQESFRVDPGDRVEWYLEAYGIPDKYIFSSGTSIVDSGGRVSGLRSGTLIAGDTKLNVMVTGDLSGTAWSLKLVNKGKAGLPTLPEENNIILMDSDVKVEFAEEKGGVVDLEKINILENIVNKNHNADEVFNLPLSNKNIVLDKVVALTSLGSSEDISATVLAGHVYLAHLSERSSNNDLYIDGSIAVRDAGSKTISMVEYSSPGSRQPFFFLQTSKNQDAIFNIISEDKLAGMANIKLYDMGDSLPTLYSVGDYYVSKIYEEETDSSQGIYIYRYGDLSKRTIISAELIFQNANSLNASDLLSPIRQEITFLPGDEKKLFLIDPRLDMVSEGAETASVSIVETTVSQSSLEMMKMIGLSAKNSVIVSDLPPSPPSAPEIMFGSATNQNGILKIPVRLSQAAPWEIAVSYLTVDGSALSGKDYQPSAGEIIFKTGEIEKNINITLSQINIINKSLSIELITPYGANLTGNTSILSKNFTIGSSVATNDILILQANSPSVISGGVGDDVYMLSGFLVPAGKSITLSDTQGSNTLQLVGGLAITGSIVTKTALQLTLNNGGVITVLGADSFAYDVGGNSLQTSLSLGSDFSNFASASLGVTVPTSGTASGGIKSFGTAATGAKFYTSPSAASDIVAVQTASPAVLSLGQGDDTYILSNSALAAGKTLTVSDAQGANSIQFVAGFAIASFTAAATALQMKYTNGAEVTLLGADQFTYDIGGNLVAGLNNTDISYASFLSTILGVTLPTTGTVSGGAKTFGSAGGGSAIPLIAGTSLDTDGTAISITLTGISDPSPVGLV